MRAGLTAIDGLGEAVAGVTTHYGSKPHFHIGYSFGIFHESTEIWCRELLHRVDAHAVVALEPGEAHGGRGTSRHVAQDGLIVDPAFVAERYGSERPFAFPSPILHDAILTGSLVAAIRSSERPRIEFVLDRLFARFAVRNRQDTPPAIVWEDETLSRFQRNRRCRAATGLSPRDLRQIRRIEAAKRMIAAGLPLAEAAEGAGFADQSHLTRQLRQLWGVTPAALKPPADR